MPFTTLSSSAITGGVGDSLRPNAKPLIINGDMAVAQRSTSVTGHNAVSYTTVDRFKTVNEIGTYTVIQESLTSGNAFNNGFKNALRMDCTTAEASGSAGDQTTFEYRMEGFDLQAFKKGTSNAQPFTLAFWVKANKTGSNIQVNLRDNTNDRQVGGTYSISSTDTWEHKVINFVADTTGVFADANTAELIIEWFLDGGSNYSGGSVPTSWEAKTNANRNVTNFDFGGSTDNDWAITGIQLEVGTYTSSTLPPFQFESYGENLHRCKRYYQGWGSIYDTGTSSISGRIISGNRFDSETIMLNPEMRAAPSISQGGTANIANYYIQYDGNAVTTGSGSSFGTLNTQKGSTRFRVTSNASISSDHVANCQTGGADGKQHLIFDADL